MKGPRKRLWMLLVVFNNLTAVQSWRPQAPQNFNFITFRTCYMGVIACREWEIYKKEKKNEKRAKILFFVVMFLSPSSLIRSFQQRFSEWVWLLFRCTQLIDGAYEFVISTDSFFKGFAKLPLIQLSDHPHNGEPACLTRHRRNCARGEDHRPVVASLKTSVKAYVESQCMDGKSLTFTWCHSGHVDALR